MYLYNKNVEQNTLQEREDLIYISHRALDSVSAILEWQRSHIGTCGTRPVHGMCPVCGERWDVRAS